jgi:DHA2 family multidrug resistance protein
MTDAAPAPARVINKTGITVSIMLATIMNALDTTIANVALPHIQGSVSASQEQIAWVLTSYIVAATIMTPLSGWLAGRIGRKHLFLISIAGFTVASALCGMANSLFEIVAFRLLQGMFGASLIPLSQAVLLDINPKEKHGQAMAIWSAGSMLGPIMGPTIGGFLTENYSWRWVFYINLPVGLLAFAGVWFFMTNRKQLTNKPFDFFGFMSLAIFIAAFQLMLDRGPSQDWWGSREICTEAVVAVIAFYLFVAHSFTAKNPFFDKALLRDRTFVIATIIGAIIGLLVYSVMALLPVMMQTTMGYPVMTTGLVSMPRGLGTFFAMFFIGRAMGRMDTRILLGAGLIFSAIASWQMTHFSLDMGMGPLIISGVFQGIGTGMVFVPLATMAFSTLDPRFRAEGSSVFTLVRNLGSAGGISVVQALLSSNTEAVHNSLVQHITPDNPVLNAYLPGAMSLGSAGGLEALNGEITRQATMVAYIDNFQLTLILCFLAMPLVMLLRRPPPQNNDAPHVAVE